MLGCARWAFVQTGVDARCRRRTDGKIGKFSLTKQERTVVSRVFNERRGLVKKCHSCSLFCNATHAALSTSYLPSKYLCAENPVFNFQ